MNIYKSINRIGLCSILLFAMCMMPVQSEAQFVDRALQRGVTHKYAENLTGGGVAIFDLNNDGRLDLFFTGGQLSDQLYLNNGNGFDRIFNYVTPEDFDYYDYYSKAVAAGDVNNDGWDDLLICTTDAFENYLMINNGDNSFDVIPGEVSGITGKYLSLGASFGDINEDGLLDIFVHNYTDSVRTIVDPVDSSIFVQNVGYRNNLYINEGDAVFQEMGDVFGVNKTGNTLASTFSDFDNDNDVDLHVVNDFGETAWPNELYRNEYPVDGFTDVSQSSGADIALFGMGVAIGDYDGDLDLDYYVTNIGRNVLMQNQGDGSFVDVTNAAGVGDSTSANGLAIGWGTGFFDYDNDGDLDLYIANGHLFAVGPYVNPEFNPNRFYGNNGDGTFEDLTEELQFADPSWDRGSAFGDLDADGDPDLVIVPVNLPFTPADSGLRVLAALYYNETENSNNWIAFDLDGTASNRNGYGAHIYLYDNSGSAQMREADGGSSHASSNSPDVHFGLGTSDGVDSVVIHWPAGTVQKILDPPLNRRISVSESPGDTVIVTGIKESEFASLAVYPNPAATRIMIELDEGLINASDIHYKIISVSGRTVLSGPVKDGITVLDVSRIPVGNYLIKVSNRAGLVESGRFTRIGAH